MEPQTNISKAKQLAKLGQNDQSRDLLREFLLSNPNNIEALLWLAKVTSNEHEAMAAAELAMALQPSNEVANRAVAAVKDRFKVEESLPVPNLDVMRITGMTLSQAREVIWPFRGLNRPIGALLDEGVLNAKDLGFAIENAKESRLMQACRTLLLSRLVNTKPEDKPTMLQYIKGYEYTAYQERRALLSTGLVLGGIFILLGLVAVGMIAVFYLLFFQRSIYFQIGFALFAAVLFMLLLGTAGLKILDRYEKQSLHYRQGREGEDRVSDILKASLTSPWTLIRNIEWPDRKWGDIDLVLFGPGGIWVFEVKAFSGQYRCAGERWQYKNRGRWWDMWKNPTDQAKRNALNLKAYLESHRIMPGFVSPIIIWANEDGNLVRDDPAVPIWTIEELSDHVVDFWRQRKLNDDQIEQCSTTLTAVIDKVKDRYRPKKN